MILCLRGDIGLTYCNKTKFSQTTPHFILRADSYPEKIGVLRENETIIILPYSSEFAIIRTK